MKICSKCKSEKGDEFFSFKKNGVPGLKSACKECHAADVRARYAADPEPRLRRTAELRKDPVVRGKINAKRNQTRRQQPALTLLRLAKVRAKQNSLPFNLELADVVIPETCPVLGLTLKWGCAKRQIDCSPTIDRVDPQKGYVKGNIFVISWRANRLKSDASLDEMRAVVAYFEAALGVAVTATNWRPT
ncbi:hypothetical protein [Massilia antarctica]|uniref:hypothetical protein n=1 Tax=Massilia antarctica TaxID=2765360 RepID=UPI002270EAB0|nr:hypothetical protein [Massilia sp. H27-R4]MCY0910859.1 hypothetical protein [Massilia sp. H27-R4]